MLVPFESNEKRMSVLQKTREEFILWNKFMSLWYSHKLAKLVQPLGGRTTICQESYALNTPHETS